MDNQKIADPGELCDKESNQNWETLSFSHNLVQMHLQIPKRIILKSFCTFSMDKQKLIEFLLNPDSMNKIFQGYAEIQQNPALIANLELPTPLGVSKRRLVVEIKRNEVENGKKISLIYIDSDHQHQNDDGYVKAEVYYMGFIVEEVSMFLTKFWFLCDIDPKGTLPNAVVEYMKKYLSLIPRKIKDRIKNKPQ